MMIGQSSWNFKASASRPDILCITETWLRSSMPDSLLTGNTNYSIVRLDRQYDSTAGGVCIMFNHLSVTAVPAHIPDKFRHLELVAIDILSAFVKTRLFTCYRPPSSNYDTNAVRYVYDLWVSNSSSPIRFNRSCMWWSKVFQALIETVITVCC
jgi:exonuclease III